MREILKVLFGEKATRAQLWVVVVAILAVIAVSLELFGLDEKFYVAIVAATFGLLFLFKPGRLRLLFGGRTIRVLSVLASICLVWVMVTQATHHIRRKAADRKAAERRREREEAEAVRPALQREIRVKRTFLLRIRGGGVGPLTTHYLRCSIPSDQVEGLQRWNWHFVAAKGKPTAAAHNQAVPPDVMKLFGGTGRIETSLTDFVCELYNGSTWYINEVTVEIETFVKRPL